MGGKDVVSEFSGPKLSLSAQDYWTFEEPEDFDESAKIAKLKEVVSRLKSQINDSSDSNASSPPMENGVPFSRRKSIRRLSQNMGKGRRRCNFRLR